MILSRNHFYHDVHVKYQNIIIIWDYHDSYWKSGKLRYQSITIKSSWEYTVAWKSIPQNSKLSYHVSLSFSNLSQVILSCDKEQTLTVTVWYIMIISKSVSFTAVYLRLAFICCQGTALYCIMIYHFITVKRRHSHLIIYPDIMIYHSITGGRPNSYLIKYSENIMIYHYIPGGRRNSNFIK